MKKLLLSFCLLSLVITGAAFGQDDAREFPSCKYCGMNREMFGQTRMLVEYEDGQKVPFCSLHCASVDMAVNIDRSVKTLWVGDFVTKKLISAYDAIWLVGSKIPGVMTKRSKAAFESKDEAAKSQKENGGEIVDFDRAIKASYEDMYTDTQMIREKRKMKQKSMQHNILHKEHSH